MYIRTLACALALSIGAATAQAQTPDKRTNDITAEQRPFVKACFRETKDRYKINCRCVANTALETAMDIDIVVTELREATEIPASFSMCARKKKADRQRKKKAD